MVEQEKGRQLAESIVQRIEARLKANKLLLVADLFREIFLYLKACHFMYETYQIQFFTIFYKIIK